MKAQDHVRHAIKQHLGACNGAENSSVPTRNRDSTAVLLSLGYIGRAGPDTTGHGAEHLSSADTDRASAHRVPKPAAIL